MNRFKYKAIDISSEKGLREAERLKEQGYEMTVIGMDKVMFAIKKEDHYERRIRL